MIDNGKEFLEIKGELKRVESTLIFKQENVLDKPLFTIAIPTYNRLDMLKEALESCFKQEYITTNGGGQEVESHSSPKLLEHLSLGMQCNRFSKFQEFADSKSSSPLKFAKNYESTTANIRMLGGEDSGGMVESNVDSMESNVESRLDSALDSKDSKQSLESSKNNPHEVRTLKACSGDKGVVKGGEGATLASLSRTPFSPFEDERIESDNLVGDSKEVDNLKDSNKLVESKLDSKSPTPSNVEIIVIENSDDCDSISPTQEFLQKHYRGKITYYKNKQNLGLFGNWNAALSLSRGKWVCILHDDDMLLPNYLRKMQYAINNVASNTSLISHRAIYFGNLDLISYAMPPRNPIKHFLKSNAKWLFNALKALKRFLKEEVLFRILMIKRYGYLDRRSASYVMRYNPLHPSCLLHNRELVLSLGGYDGRYYPSDDWFFHIRCAMHSNVYMIDEFLSKYRYESNATFNKSTIKMGAIVNYLHIRDNINVSKRMREILLLKHLEGILKIEDEGLREELLRLISIKARRLGVIDKILYKLYRLRDVEVYRCEG